MVSAANNINNTDDAQLTSLCTYLYAIFAASMLLQMTFATLVLGLIAMIAVLVIAYMNRKKLSDTSVFKSHFDWIIRTFWIGTGVYLPLCVVVMVAAILKFVDLEGLSNLVLNQAETSAVDPQAIIDTFLDQNGKAVKIIMGATGGPFLLWWFLRCWRGYSLLRKGLPLTQVRSWL